MIYSGRWGRADFDALARDGDGRAAFQGIVEGATDDPWQGLGQGPGQGIVDAYVFRCPVCGQCRGHWDVD
jgi:hypothetical protein